ncbi:MAG TPA: sigma-54 dependent transcriptional regulator [Alphaproteobacteria bacterium]|nr:sigma-54 dependent transcriptional regulator [Alphaproteobacteria bacterium]
MRLMIIGQLEGYMGAAGKIALQRGAKVMHCEDTAQAVGALLGGKGADLVMIDIKQKIGAFVDRLRTERIHIPVVACGVGSDARAAVRAIQEGAKEYVPLPPDATLIAAILEAVTEESNTMIAADPAMVPVVKMAEKIAPSEATVLITGESGTGKEVMAQFIHRKSRRKDGPFIAINCAAIPESLLESELFGHEKGAFTGATARRVGKFEEATGGTLLLDEVSEMQPSLQAKFLRALQEREITRVGSNEPVKIDVRILATSNRNLGDSVSKGEFREALYFRLNVVNLRLPSLRERPADIPALAQFFADKYADANAMPRKKIATDTAALLTAYGWRGNVRELENTMHRAILLSMAEDIEPQSVQLQDGLSPSAPVAPVSRAVPGTAESAQDPAATPVDVQNPGAVAALIGRSIADVERDMILNTLDHCIGNRTHAANILGISIRTLRNKLAQYREEGVPIPAASGGES